MYASNLVGHKYKRRSWIQDKYFFLRGLSTRKCLKSVSQETKKLHIVFIGPISIMALAVIHPLVNPHFELLDLSKLLNGFL